MPLRNKPKHKNMQNPAKKPKSELEYLVGFGNHFESEALPDSLPRGMNNPKVCPRGLYAEQLSGTSFTTPHHKNLKSWLYRIIPSVKHSPLTPLNDFQYFVSDFTNAHIDPRRFRWHPLALPESPQTFLQGIRTMMGTGSPETKQGIAIHMYTANCNMENESFLNADGDFLLVPQLGELHIQTEFGKLNVPPGHICVIPRGIVYKVLVDGPSRGYICEVFTSHLTPPERGPIGANGMANERDFEYPVASFDDSKDAQDFVVIHKFCGKFFSRHQENSPFNVVAWHGNYVPFRYDLEKYCAMNSVTYDHPDPSIFTVLTAPTDTPGVAALDFAIFPRRWQVQWDTFRIPYYHRNCMSEFMGNVYGQYEAKPQGFVPGASTLHSCMSSHGPDAEAFEKCSSADESPMLLKPSLSFMFESTYIFKLTDFALNGTPRDESYSDCWNGLQSHFQQ